VCLIQGLPFVSQQLLPPLCAAAQFLAMPSLIESFGLPVLEAMAAEPPLSALGQLLCPRSREMHRSISIRLM
jgi:glycosyltransferase involved in cell wall biosynthesis